MNTAPLPYIDNSGRPRLRSSIVAFLDILGFSHASTTNLQDSQHVLDKIVDAIEDSRSFVRESFGAESRITSDWGLKFFSDNLALGYPLDDERNTAGDSAAFVLRCVQRYQLRMALNGVFLRGAMTVGPLCLTDEIIFGSALVECYQLESKASIVPRVLLAEPMRQLIADCAAAKNDEVRQCVRNAICRDVDGWWFVNYLQAAECPAGVDWECIVRHKQSILDSLSTTTRHDVLPKFGWACRYHNVFCHWHRQDAGYSDRYRIDRVDEQSTILRFGDTAAASS